MFQVCKDEPDFFKKATRRVQNINISTVWNDDKIRQVRGELRNHIAQNEQKNLCIYCEKKLKKSSCHIDHLKKRDFFPQDTLNYQNLLVSCNSENRCAKYKDKCIAKEDYDDFVNPVVENPEIFLEYTFFGELQPKSNLNDYNKHKAQFTIRILSLNDASLVDERKSMILGIKDMIDNIQSRTDLDIFENFYTLKNWIYLYKGELR